MGVRLALLQCRAWSKPFDSALIHAHLRHRDHRYHLHVDDATAVVLTPAILAAVKKAGVEPLSHLFACALIANAASFVLPISNPANLVVFHQGMPSLLKWLFFFGIPFILSIAANSLVLRLHFRQDLHGAINETPETEPLRPEGKIVLGGIAFMVFVLLAASSFNKDLGLPTCFAALVVTAAVSLRGNSNPLGLAKEISWSTLALVAGLFVMVDAIESMGALKFTEQAMHWAQTPRPALGTSVVGFVLVSETIW